VAANETAFVLSAIGDAQGLIDAKKVKVLAVGSRTRSAQHPNIPTLAEIYNGVVTVNYNGLFAPRATPVHVLEYLNWAWHQAVVDSDTAASLVRRGNVPLGGDLARARQFYNTYYDSRERLYKKYQHLLSK
jgi:tripartite-type tricarboxylate transporter receptor subunit TctC